MQGSFEKFTERARKVLSLAQEEAQRFNHNYIGTEHLLLGLVREGDGVAAKVLSNLGVELTKVRSSIEFVIGRGDQIVLGEIGLTPRAKKVIELAVDEARRFNHHYIGTEHLLLGLVREGEGIAAGVLESLGVNLEKVRSQTIQVLSQSGKLQGAATSGLTAMSGESAVDTAIVSRFVPPTPSRAVRGRQGPLGTLVLGVGLVTLGIAVAEALLAYAQNILPASAQVAAVGTLKFGWTAAVLVIMLVLCAERQRTGYVLALITGILFATLGLLGHPYNELFYDQSGPFQPNATGPLTTLQLALTIAGGALAISALLALLFERRAGRAF